VDDKAGRARAPLTDLVVGHLKHMFGLRSLAQAKLQEMLAGLRFYYRRKQDHLAGLFTRLVGMYDELPGHGVNSVMQVGMRSRRCSESFLIWMKSLVLANRETCWL
jgi:hypothetical protein